MDEAPTAERASCQEASKGWTTRRSAKPKLAMARAAAPMFRGLRVCTSTTQMRSREMAGCSVMGQPWLFYDVNTGEIQQGQDGS